MGEAGNLSLEGQSFLECPTESQTRSCDQGGRNVEEPRLTMTINLTAGRPTVTTNQP